MKLSENNEHKGQTEEGNNETFELNGDEELKLLQEMGRKGIVGEIRAERQTLGTVKH